MTARDECLDLVYFSGCDDEGDVSPTLLYDLWEPIISAEVRERIAQDLERLAGIAVDPREALAYFSAARIARGGTR